MHFSAVALATCLVLALRSTARPVPVPGGCLDFFCPKAPASEGHLPGDHATPGPGAPVTAPPASIAAPFAARPPPPQSFPLRTLSTSSVQTSSSTLQVPWTPTLGHVANPLAQTARQPSSSTLRSQTSTLQGGSGTLLGEPFRPDQPTRPLSPATVFGSTTSTLQFGTGASTDPDTGS